MNDFIASIIRTYTPWLVGLVVGWLASVGIDLPDAARADLGLLVAFVAAAAWYVAVRALEKRWPALGVLLGVPKPPTYGAPAPADDAPKHAAL